MLKEMIPISSRAICMNLLGPTIITTGDYVPFTNLVTRWAVAGPDSFITYHADTKQFVIPNASSNDYYIIWQIALMTANIAGYPIIALDLTYNGVTRSDNILSPIKTQEIVNSSLFHITEVSADDELLIGLKILGDSSQICHLSCISTANISAEMVILGL